jgi:large subunit ribosomal protein L1
MARHGKLVTASREQAERDREHTPAEAVELVKRLARAKFDESIEVHIRTGLNVRHADEQLRGTVALPNGLGRDVTIAVFAQGDAARELRIWRSASRRASPTSMSRSPRPT